jgi:pyruvate formate lyase activating enzyme
MKEAYLYKKLKDKAVQCETCCHFCVIQPGNKGLCQMRENQGGKLIVLNYGESTGVAVDPI